jgi:glycosyltransferase involved in cell wall biosynthesis
MNILMIAYALYPFDHRIAREAEALVKGGHHVSILTLAESDEPKCYISEGVEVVELPIRKYRGKRQETYLLVYLQFLLLAFWQCTTRFIRGKIDVVHVHNMPNFMVFAGLIPWLFGRKIVLDVHDTLPETYAGKLGKLPGFLRTLLLLEERVCCAMASRVICVNDMQRDALLARGIPREKITVILNVPDEGIFRFADHFALVNGNRPIFNLVYHGVIDRMLGLDLMLDAVARLQGEIPDLHFHVIGAGPYLDYLVEKSKNLGLTDRVHFSMRYYPIKDLPDMLDDMDLGVIPNRRNAATELMLPVKLLEYVSLGLPAIAPRLKTIEHYFSADMVTYFEPGDAGSMAEAILAMHGNKSRRMEQMKKSRTFLDRYGWEKHQLDLVRMYEGLR